jgi:hypothetical protein
VRHEGLREHRKSTPLSLAISLGGPDFSNSRLHSFPITDRS